MAEAYNVRVAPPNCGSALSTAASLQIAASIANFMIQGGLSLFSRAARIRGGAGGSPRGAHQERRHRGAERARHGRHACRTRARLPLRPMPGLTREAARLPTFPVPAAENLPQRIASPLAPSRSGNLQTLVATNPKTVPQSLPMTARNSCRGPSAPSLDPRFDPSLTGKARWPGG